MITRIPEWPGLTHHLVVRTETRADLDGEATMLAIGAALARLERDNPGKGFIEIGRDICQRVDLEHYPWQLFIGLQEVSDAV